MSEPGMFVVNVQVALRCEDELLVIGRSVHETHDGHSVINVVFAATISNPSPAIPQASEVSFAKWLPLREVLSHPDLPLWTADYIRQAFPEIGAE